eukprot:12174589-Karenia_brevis.AAC.1
MLGIEVSINMWQSLMSGRTLTWDDGYDMMDVTASTCTDYHCRKAAMFSTSNRYVNAVPPRLP